MSGSATQPSDSEIKEDHSMFSSATDTYTRTTGSFGTAPVQSGGHENPTALAGVRNIRRASQESPHLNETTFASELKTIKNWWNLGIALYVLWGKLDEIERVYTSVVDRLKALYAYFRQMHPYANWRSVIWGLDECNDTELADKIRSYAEPITDSTLTVENILEVLKHLKSGWYGKLSRILAVPPPKKMEFKESFSAEEDRLKEFIKYIHAFHPRMSWETLAGVLYSMEEQEALEHLLAKGYCNYKQDPSLTLENVRKAISGMKNWHRFGWWIDVPLPKRDEIKSQIFNLEDQIDALIREWLSNHPAPSWYLLAWALLRRREAPEHMMLKSLHGNYIPDEYITADASLLKSFIRKVVKKNEILGRGSYGSVEVVLWHGKEYAAKRPRAHFLEKSRKKFYEQFRTEYEVLSSLHHENIVVYVGLCFLAHSDQADVPLLMMERMKIDLHTRLIPDLYSEVYSDPLSLEEKLFILRGVAEGLNYLHTRNPPVIHRDLTATNVLLDENNVVKIADFGNSRILGIDQSSCIATMSCIPGTVVYSAPEALPIKSNVRYNAKIDTFSFGHLILFVLVDEFPCDLLQPVFVGPDGSKRALSEVERREKYMTKLKRVTNERGIPQLYGMTTKCLDNRPASRPCAMDIIKTLKQQ